MSGFGVFQLPWLRPAASDSCKLRSAAPVVRFFFAQYAFFAMRVSRCAIVFARGVLTMCCKKSQLRLPTAEVTLCQAEQRQLFAKQTASRVPVSQGATRSCCYFPMVEVA